MSKSKVDKKVFSERLKKLMETNNETTYSLAEIVHLSSATISRYANGEMAPKVPTIEVMARHFEVNPAWLLGYDVPKKLKKEKEEINVIAAHLEGEKLTKEEEEEIKKYIDFILSKRK